MTYIFAQYHEVYTVNIQDRKEPITRVAKVPQRERTDWEGPSAICLYGIGTFYYHGLFWMADGSLFQAGPEGPGAPWQGFVFEESCRTNTTSRPAKRIALAHGEWSRLATKAQYSKSVPEALPRSTSPYHRLAATHAFLINLFERTEIEDRGRLARSSIVVEGRRFYLWEILGLDVDTGAPLQDGYLAPHGTL